MRLQNIVARRRVPGALLATLAGMAAIGVGRDGAPARHTASVKVQPTVFIAQAPAPVVPEPSALPEPTVIIDVEGQHKSDPDPEALGALRTSVNMLLSGAQSGAEGASNWVTWGQMESPMLKTTVSLPEAVTVYATRFVNGATVCIQNRSQRKTPTVVRLHLGRGVYKIERLTFTPPTPAIEMPSGGNVAPAATPVMRLERLEGRTLQGSSLIRKQILLQPGQICFLRCIDEVGQARQAVFAAEEHLHLLALHSAGPARKLRRILMEGMSDLHGLAHSGGSGRLSCVHHLLLITAQVHSLCRNYQARGNIDSEIGADVMSDLEQLTDSLAEMSANLLGLVPQITLETDLTGGAHTDQASLQNPGDPKTLNSSALVTISLENTGEQSISPIKIGLDSSALPSGVSCDPLDPAIFRTLRPGQTVRATFHLHYSAPLSENRCVGDISFFAEGTPAHLRPRPW